jgi:hypothetical protein
MRSSPPGESDVMSVSLDEEAQAGVSERVHCTRTGEAVAFLLPDLSVTIVAQDTLARSSLLVELLNATAGGAGFELPAREGIAWLACAQMQAEELQQVNDAQLVEFLKV